MTNYFDVGGQRVISGEVGIPSYGTWVADVWLATATPPTGTNPIFTMGNFTMLGTIIESTSFIDSRHIRMVGGFGGWQKLVPGQAQSQTRTGPGGGQGITLSQALTQTARVVGEQINVKNDYVMSPNVIRFAGQAKEVLDQLAGNWYIDNSGVTQIGVRPSRPITSQFTLLNLDGGRQICEISTEDPASWIPGNTFTSPTLTITPTISYARWELNNQGAPRLFVLYNA